MIEEKKNDFWIAKNEQYKTVKIISNKNLLGKFVKVKITKAHEWALEGILISEK